MLLKGRVIRTLRQGQQKANHVHVGSAHGPAEPSKTAVVEEVDLAGEAHQVVNHAKQAHRSAVIRRVDLRNARFMEGFDLRRRDGTAASTEDSDVFAAGLIEQLANVGEVLHVAALVGGQRYRVGVFLNGTIDDVPCRAVVTKMNHFRTGGLNQPAHDVDGRVVAVKQRSGGDDAHRSGARREVGLARLHVAHGPTWDFGFIKSAPGSVVRIWHGQRTSSMFVTAHTVPPFIPPTGRCTGEHSAISKTMH